MQVTQAHGKLPRGQWLCTWKFEWNSQVIKDEFKRSIIIEKIKSKKKAEPSSLGNQKKWELLLTTGKAEEAAHLGAETGWRLSLCLLRLVNLLGSLRGRLIGILGYFSDTARQLWLESSHEWGFPKTTSPELLTKLVHYFTNEFLLPLPYQLQLSNWHLHIDLLSGERTVLSY